MIVKSRNPNNLTIILIIIGLGVATIGIGAVYASSIIDDDLIVNGQVDIVRDGWNLFDIRASSVGADAGIRMYADDDFWSVHNDDSASNNLSIRYNNAEKLAVTKDGNIGIGTASPQRPLDIQFSGDNGVRIKSTDGLASLYVDSGNVDSPQYIRFMEDGKSNFWLTAVSDALLFRPDGGTPSVVFTDDGKVGIGTRNPQEKLDINGNINLSGNILSDGDICIGKC